MVITCLTCFSFVYVSPRYLYSFVVRSQGAKGLIAPSQSLSARTLGSSPLPVRKDGDRHDDIRVALELELQLTGLGIPDASGFVAAAREDPADSPGPDRQPGRFILRSLASWRFMKTLFLDVFRLLVQRALKCMLKFL